MNDLPDQLRETYNKIAQDWHAEHLSDDWWVTGTKKFISLFQPNDRILDVGCAGGKKSEYMIQHSLQVTGIDISEAMIKIAKNRVPEAQFLRFDLSEITSLPEMYDGIFMQAVLLHVQKKDAALRVKQLATKLKPNGYFYIAVKDQKPNKPEEEIKIENNYGYQYERFFSYYTVREIMQYLTAAGLTIHHQRLSPCSKVTWIEVIGKNKTRLNE